jgi:hypothetical protein
MTWRISPDFGRISQWILDPHKHTLSDNCYTCIHQIYIIYIHVQFAHTFCRNMSGNYIYIYMCVCVCVCLYICIYIYVYIARPHTSMRMHENTHVLASLHPNWSIHFSKTLEMLQAHDWADVYKCTILFTYAYVRVCVCLYIYIYIYIYIYACMYILLRVSNWSDATHTVTCAWFLKIYDIWYTCVYACISPSAERKWCNQTQPSHAAMVKCSIFLHKKCCVCRYMTDIWVGCVHVHTRTCADTYT